MKFVDPLVFRNRKQPEAIIFAASQLQGGKDTQEDYFINFKDECFVVTDGVGSLPHPEVAAKLAAETAIWGYKHIRQRPFYWADKKLFLKRIFRSANIAVWQKKRERGFSEGLATTLATVIVGTNSIWAGSVGDTGILLYREGLIDMLTPYDLDEAGRLTNALGVKRFGLVPHVKAERFIAGDVLLIASDGVLSFVSEDVLRTTFEVTGTTTDSMSAAIVHLLRTAEENGSDDNMTACMIKKLSATP